MLGMVESPARLAALSALMIGCAVTPHWSLASVFRDEYSIVSYGQDWNCSLQLKFCAREGNSL